MEVYPINYNSIDELIKAYDEVLKQIKDEEEQKWTREKEKLLKIYY